MPDFPTAIMRSIIQKIRDFRIVKLRDEDAYAEFYREEHPRIIQFVRGRVDRIELAEDLANEAFVEVWRYIFRERQVVQHLQALLFTIVRRLVIDHYRKQKGGEHLDTETVVDTIPASGSIIDELALDEETRGVRDVLRTLRDEYREILNLRFIDEFEIHEIAALLNKTPGAVRVLLHRSLAALRKEVKK